MKKLRVLSVAHTGVRHAVGRARYEPLSACSDVDLTLLVPSAWHEYGARLDCEPAVGDLRIATSRPRLVSCGPMKWYLHFYPDLGRLIRKMQPDVLHLWEEPWSVVALQACLLRSRVAPNTAIVLEADQNIYRRLPPPFEWIRRTTLRQTDLMIARQAEAEIVLRKSGYTGPVRMVGYGVDQTVFHPPVGDVPSLHAERSLNIGYIGRMVAEKGIFDLLEAISASSARVNLLVVGDGPDLPRFSESVCRLGLESRVRMMGPQPLSAVAEIMRGLDIVTLFSKTTSTWKEQFGRVIIEAHACGVPVIGSSSGAIPEVIAQGGWIVPEGDVPGLAALLRHLDHHRDEIASKSADALENISSRYTYGHVATALCEAYHATSAHRRPALS